MNKYYVIAGPALMLLALVSFIIAGSIPSTVTRETDLVKYTQTGKFTYLINLKPSYLYGPTPQIPTPDPKYPAAAVESLDFTYSFSPAVKGPQSTHVEAVLENPGIWQKIVALVGETSTSGDFPMSFSLDPSRMNALFDSIEKETGITATPCSLHIDAVTKVGNSLIVQSLPVTLDGNLIEVSSNLNQTLPEGTGKFDYKVNRKTMSDGLQPLPAAKYPAAVVNTLDFTFKYQPARMGAAAASIEAVLENPDIWQKKVILVAEKDISDNMTLNFSLNLDSLINQFNEIDKATRLTTSPRLVTLKAMVAQGNERFVQSLPFTIDKDLLEIPGDLKSAQPAGIGTFDYVLNLKPNTLFSTSTLRPPQPSLMPSELLTTVYDINLIPPQSADLPETVLGPDQTAFTKLIDKMKVTLNYQFQADQTVKNLNTDVAISAIVEAPKVWSRTISLLQTSKSGNFSLTFPVDIASYGALVQAINTETGVSPDSIGISIIATFHTTGETSSGKINEIFSPALKGTIAGNVLQWNKDLTTSQPGGIKTKQTSPNPNHYLGFSAGLAKTLVFILASVFLVLFGLILALFIRTKPALLSPVKNNANRIKKKYGERLVKALDHTPPEAEKVVTVDSMEDLIKVADELSKPIVYQTPGSSLDPYAYFVVDGTNRYQYLPNVSGPPSGSEEES